MQRTLVNFHPSAPNLVAAIPPPAYHSNTDKKRKIKTIKIRKASMMGTMPDGGMIVQRLPSVSPQLKDMVRSNSTQALKHNGINVYK